MIASYKNKVNIYVGLGIVIVMGAGLYKAANPGMDNSLADLTAFAGTGLFIYGLYNYAKAKGYSGWFGLLGFLYIIGLIILVVLPDRRKNG